MSKNEMSISAKIPVTLTPKLNSWIREHAAEEEEDLAVIIRRALKAYKKQIEREALKAEVIRREVLGS